MKNIFLKNRFLPALTLSCILITGCGKNSDIKIPYDNKSATNITASTTEDVVIPKDALFADDKCIISNQTNDTDERITAKAALVINQTDKTALFACNPYERLYPASITKIMTAYITLKYANMEDVVTVSYEAANINESGIKRCGFNEGDKIKVKDLLYSTIVYSGNDAATALACHISGNENEFSKLMNKEALAMGATDTHFTNANGLHNDKHYTTAYDLYLIFTKCLENEEFKKIINTSSHTVEYVDSKDNTQTKTFSTTNQYLLGNKDVPSGITIIGGKTGTTSKAGHCLILYSEDNDNKSYITLALNTNSSDDLYNQMSTMLNMTTEKNE